MREGFDGLELGDGEEKVVFMGGNQGEARRAEILVGFCKRPSKQDETLCEADVRSVDIVDPCSHGGLQLTRCQLET